MRQVASLFVFATVLASPLAHSPQSNAVGTAVEAANRWLVLSDAGDGAATWDTAAPSFRAAITKTAWSQALSQARQPLGAVKARKLSSFKLKRSLPGAPDGEYVVIQYDTQFEHKAHAVETVTPMRDQDGSWKVSGYFLK